MDVSKIFENRTICGRTIFGKQLYMYCTTTDYETAGKSRTITLKKRGHRCPYFARSQVSNFSLTLADLLVPHACRFMGTIWYSSTLRCQFSDVSSLVVLLKVVP